MNKVIMIGRLTKDADLRSTTSGKQVASFSIAVNRKYKKDEADFFDVVAWDKTAEFVTKYICKGMQIAVEGRLQNRQWEGNDGVMRYATEIIADDIYFADSKKKEDYQGSPAKSNTINSERPVADYRKAKDTDGLPF